MPTASVTINTPLHPTESPEKVEKAVLNIFPDADLEVGDDSITGRASDLERFREILRDLRIRDTARHFLMSRIRGNRIMFSISKQAAYVGKISFGGNRPALGEIELIVETDDPVKLIEWLTFTGD